MVEIPGDLNAAALEQDPKDNWWADPEEEPQVIITGHDSQPRRRGRVGMWLGMAAVATVTYFGGFATGQRVPPLEAEPPPPTNPQVKDRLDTMGFFATEMAADVLTNIDEEGYETVYLNLDPEHNRGVEIGMAYDQSGARYNVYMYFEQNTDGSIIPYIDTLYKLNVEQVGCELPNGKCNDYVTRQTILKKLTDQGPNSDEEIWYGSDTLWSNDGNGSEVVFRRDTWLDEPDKPLYSHGTQVALSNMIQIDHVLGDSLYAALGGHSAMYLWDEKNVVDKQVLGFSLSGA